MASNLLSYWREKWSSMNSIQKVIRVSEAGVLLYVSYRFLDKGPEFVSSMSGLLSEVHQEELQLLTLQDFNTLFVAWSLIFGSFAILLTALVTIEVVSRFSNFLCDFAEYYEEVERKDE